MEIREFARQILEGASLEEKLFSPEALTDHAPGTALRIDDPARSAEMRFTKRGAKEKLPSFQEHHKAENRAICLHRFAGHELLAVEMMAFALLAFPEAPKTFRKGVAHTLMEEQEHVRLYAARLKEMGVNFGDLPLYRHFWTHTSALHTPLQYISLVSLTFEMANLDFAPHYGASFEKAGDTVSAGLMATIFADELRHVRFGLNWLHNFKPEGANPWQTWLSSLSPKVHPRRAKGLIYSREARLAAGVDLEWIDELYKA
jgi:uncharacterized ferritin-like protein (DUF455 family)